MWTRAYLLYGVLLSGLVGAITPPALAAQSVRHTVAGVRRTAPERAASTALIIQREAKPGLGAHILAGALIGGAIGVLLARQDCKELFTDGECASAGGLIGAGLGAAVAILVFDLKKFPPALTGDTP